MEQTKQKSHDKGFVYPKLKERVKHRSSSSNISHTTRSIVSASTGETNEETGATHPGQQGRLQSVHIHTQKPTSKSKTKACNNYHAYLSTIIPILIGIRKYSVFELIHIDICCL
jgi:hypothetical protein